MDCIIEKMKVFTVPQGEALVEFGKPKGFHLWILLNGELLSSSGKKIGVCECIGDKELTEIAAAPMALAASAVFCS